MKLLTTITDGSNPLPEVSSQAHVSRTEGMKSRGESVLVLNE